MEIEYLRPEEFRILGISTTELKTKISLTINGKKFRRKKDTPLQFKQKVANICQEIKANGQDFYVVQHTHSYSIWEEIIDTSITHNEQDKTLVQENKSSEIQDNILLNKTISDNISHTKSVVKTTTEKKSNFQTLKSQSSMPEMKVFVRNEETLAKISPQSIIEGENKMTSFMPHVELVTPVEKINTQVKTIKKYRGTIIEESKNNTTPNVSTNNYTPAFKTVKKYRGVIIEDNQNNTSVANSKAASASRFKRKYRGVIIED